jgi:hypothetical protein
MLGIQQKCNSPRRNIAFRRGDPLICTDAIFILRWRFFQGRPERILSICCGTLTIRSPSSCFVMYDPRLPLITLQLCNKSTTHLESDDDSSAPRDCRDWKWKSRQYQSFRSPLLRGGGRTGQPRPFAVRSKLTNGRTAQAKLVRPAARASFAYARIKCWRSVVQLQVSIDLHRPLEAHNMRAC